MGGQLGVRKPFGQNVATALTLGYHLACGVLAGLVQVLMAPGA